MKGLTEEQWKLPATTFEALYTSFRETIGRELTSEDYLNLFEKNNLVEFIKEVNKTQMKYLRKDSGAGNLDVVVSKEIPIGDCIITEIDAEGNFNGF